MAKDMSGKPVNTPIERKEGMVDNMGALFDLRRFSLSFLTYTGELRSFKLNYQIKKHISSIG